MHVLNLFGSVYGEDDVSFIEIKTFCGVKAREPSSVFLFLLSFQFSRRTRAEPLATQPIISVKNDELATESGSRKCVGGMLNV